MPESAAPPPLISVCIAVHNRAALVRETLNSVLAQDYPRVEIVVQDDGSDDGTADVLAEYAARHPSVAVERNPRNLGTTRTINRAFDRATGDLLLKLDSDDLIAPDYLRTCAEALQGEGIDVVTTGHRWLEDGRYRPAVPKIPGGVMRGGLRTILIVHPFQTTFLARRTFLHRIRRHGKVFWDHVTTCDFELWIRVVAQGGRVLFLADYQGLSMRRHPGNLSKGNRVSYRDTAFSILINHKAFVAQCPWAYRYKLSRIWYHDWRDWWRRRPVDWRLHRAVWLALWHR